MENTTTFQHAIGDVPGVGILLRFLPYGLDSNASQLMSIYLVLYGLYQSAIYVYYWLSEFVMTHFTSSIEIMDEDDLYRKFREFILGLKVSEDCRELVANTADQDLEYKSPSADDEASDERGFFSFGKWCTNMPIHYTPGYGTRYFFHKKRLFQCTFEHRESIMYRGDDEVFTLRCLGRSTKPLKELLREVRDTYEAKRLKKKTTEVFRQSSSHRGCWEFQVKRPSRSLQTVYLEEKQKAQIVLDINEYLLTTTARWYASRGIPYRRGYLLHGPPGTGKTSLSFALAGLFGLGIYTISFGDKTLTESELAALFANLPERCIVLLEDVDTAGINRDTSGSSEDSNEKDNQDKGQNEQHSEPNEKNDSQNDKGLSLASLLNVIDGAASHEGRILIMTTNHPQKLDAALIRPGRVDLQIEFTLCTKSQIRDMFKRMYDSKLDEPEKDTKSQDDVPLDKSKEKGLADLSRWEDLPFDLTPYMTENKAVKVENLDELADRFAEAIPEMEFSPAEIQGFLLVRKRDPEKAVEDVGDWVREQMKPDEEESAEGEDQVTFDMSNQSSGVLSFLGPYFEGLGS